MLLNNASLAVVLVGVVAAACTSACKNSSEFERQEPGTAQLRSARTTELRERAIDENDHLVNVRREQLELRARLQREIGDIDRKLAADPKVELRDGGHVVDPKSRNAPRNEELLERRRRLHEDITTVERADERGWDELKAAVERRLDEHRPGGHI